MSRASERAARERANEVLKAAHKHGEEVGGEYGAGAMTKHQKKSQATHIPITEGPKTRWQKFKRDAIG